MKKVFAILALTFSMVSTSFATTVNFDEVILPTLTPLDGAGHYAAYGLDFADNTQYAVDSRFAEDNYGITSTSGPNNLVTVLFDEAVTNVSFGWLTILSNDLFADAYDGDGNLVSSWSITGLSGDSTGTAFLAGTGIRRITWHDGTGMIGIDSITFDAAAVPEPSTWALMGLGLIGLVAVRRRKKA